MGGTAMVEIPYWALALCCIGVLLTAAYFIRRSLRGPSLEKTLRESEERVRMCIEHAMDAVIVMDSKGVLMAWNPQAEKIFGWSQAEVLGRRMSETIIPPKYRLMHEKGIQRFLETGEGPLLNKRVELTALHHEGHEFPVELTVSPAPIGKDYIFSAFVRDITDQKKAEADSARALSLLQATLDSTTDGILVVDVDGKMVSFNQKFVEMWHVPESIIESRDDSQALSFVLDQLNDPEDFLRKVRELYGNKDDDSYDTLHFKDGRTFERFSHPQKLDDHIVGRVWSFRDVTDRIRDEEKIQRFADELQRSNTELEQFAYVASHDMHEPLRKIITFGDRLKKLDLSCSEEKAHDYLDRMASSADRMRGLIDDLLSFSKFTTKPPEYEEVDLGKVLQAAMLDLEMPIARSHAQIEVGKLPTIQADEHQMRELFQNLISNAVKFRRPDVINNPS